MFTLDDYTEDDIIKIVLLYSKEINFNLTKDIAKLIANRSRLSPRIAKQYVDRINFLITSGYRPKTLRGITTAFNDIGVREGGYTELDIKYMDTLSKLGVTSLQNISRILKIDKDTIINSIEPFLLEKGHIEITAKGRRFVEW
jgi:Holliday junction DNA helicase RuvB